MLQRCFSPGADKHQDGTSQIWLAARKELAVPSCKSFSTSQASNQIPLGRGNPMKLICRLEGLSSAPPPCPANGSVCSSHPELIKSETALAGFFLRRRLHCSWTLNGETSERLQLRTDVFLNSQWIFENHQEKRIPRPQRKMFPYSFGNRPLLFKDCYSTSLYKLFKSWLLRAISGF